MIIRISFSLIFKAYHSCNTRFTSSFPVAIFEDELFHNSAIDFTDIRGAINLEGLSLILDFPLGVLKC